MFGTSESVAKTIKKCLQAPYQIVDARVMR